MLPPTRGPSISYNQIQILWAPLITIAVTGNSPIKSYNFP
jgi:hypothetical protein